MQNYVELFYIDIYVSVVNEPEAVNLDTGLESLFEKFYCQDLSIIKGKSI